MIRLLAFAILFLVSAGTASAMNIADPTKSHVDPLLVANISGADMGNVFHVNVRDASNLPRPGQTVSLIFYGTAARPLLQQEPGTTVSCGSPSILSRTSDANGDVFFHARVAGFFDTIVFPSQGIQVRANGILLRTDIVRSTDLNGDGAMDLADLDLFRQQFLAHPGPGPGDFNQDGVTNLTDLNLFRAEYLTGARGTVCP